MNKISIRPHTEYLYRLFLLLYVSDSQLPCVWLRDEWVGLDPTRILGTEPTHPLFGCTSDFGDGVNPFHVWLEELGIRVGWHDNTINEGPTYH